MLDAADTCSLVNNAGIGTGSREPSALHEADEELWDDTMRINSKSVFLGCKYALAQMLQQDPHPSGDRGWIVNISSIASLVAIGGIGMNIPYHFEIKLTDQDHTPPPKEP